MTMNAKSMWGLCRVSVTLLVALLATAMAEAVDVPQKALPELSEPVQRDFSSVIFPATDVDATRLRSRRFHAESQDSSKFLTFPTTGWPGGAVHWRYKCFFKNG